MCEARSCRPTGDKVGGGSGACRTEAGKAAALVTQPTRLHWSGGCGGGVVEAWRGSKVMRFRAAVGQVGELASWDAAAAHRVHQTTFVPSHVQANQYSLEAAGGMRLLNAAKVRVQAPQPSNVAAVPMASGGRSLSLNAARVRPCETFWARGLRRVDLRAGVPLSAFLPWCLLTRSSSRPFARTLGILCKPAHRVLAW